MKKVLIHYFSGTGNTYHMIKLIGDKLIEQGYEIEYAKIEGVLKKDFNSFPLHIFAYPVYGFGTPAMVLRYLRSIKTGNGCKAAILCTCGGFEGQSLQHTAAILKRKGFDVFLTEMGVYPDNWTQVFKPEDIREQDRIFKAADEKIKELAYKIGKQEVSFRKRSIFNLAWSWIVFLIFSSFARRILGKVYVADNTCTFCGKCKNVCPSGAIVLKDGKPRWNWKCESCQRCMNICPVRSIQTSPYRLGLFLIIEIGLIFITVKLTGFWNLSALTGIVMYLVLNIILHYLIDIAMYLFERIPGINGIMSKSYTQKYGRYMVDEFKKVL